MSFQDFSLIPVDDPASSPADDLAAAVEGALALGDDLAPLEDGAPVPFGRSWLFDWQTGQFVRRGQTPVEVVGLDVIAQFCLMSIHTARYSSPIVPDEYGMEKPDSVIGSLVEDEVLADWQANLVDALLVHERITAVRNIRLRWEPAEGVLYLDGMDVITDEDESVTVSDVTLQTGGAL